MIKKLLVLMAAGALIAIVCFTILGMLGGFNAVNQFGPWNGWGWGGRPGPRYANDWRYNGGPDTTRNLAFNGGPRLDIYYPADIVVTQGPEARFTVTGPQGLLDQLVLTNGTLYGPRGGPRWNWGEDRDGRLRIDIVTPDTHEFHLAGAQKLSLRGYDQDSLYLYAAGAADVDGAGKARRLEAHISGAGHLALGELVVQDALIAISGAGDAEIDPHASADVSISGAGHVNLRTRPPYLQTHISGFGSVDAPPQGSFPPPASSAPPAASPPPAAPPSKSKIDT